MDIFTTGTYDATDLLASVTTGAQTTFASLGPVVAVVAGIVLAFVIIPKIVSLFKSTGRSRSL